MYRSHLFYIRPRTIHLKNDSGMTKQWIGIEEAADKYQLSAEQIYKWSKGSEVTFTEVDNYWLLDEDSLMECIYRNIRVSLAQEELDARAAELLKVNKERLFVLQMLKELTPPIRIILKMLADMIVDEGKREFFLLVALGGDMQKYASVHGRKYNEVKREFEKLVWEVGHNSKFLESYWKEHTLLKAKVRRYEQILRQPMNGKGVPEINVEEVEDSSLPDMKKHERALSLLDTSVFSLGLPTRAQRMIIKGGMETLRDLLRFIRKNGVDGLCCFSQLGPVSAYNVGVRLQELNILDKEGNSYLFPYLEDDFCERVVGLS